MGFRFGYDSILGSDLNLKITMKKLLSEVTRTKKIRNSDPSILDMGRFKQFLLFL